MKKKRTRWIIIIAILVIILAIFFIRRSAKSGNRELVIRTHVVSTYTVENTVTATGTIEPVETVEVGTQVSGKVETIYVDFNSVVKKGDLLCELDKLTLNESLSRAKANLTSAESQLKYAKLSFERTQQLYEANAATLADFEAAQNTYTQAQMSMKNAQAQYDQARVDLGYADIYSPIDGVVLDRAVEVGQTVAASFSTPTLFINRDIVLPEGTQMALVSDGLLGGMAIELQLGDGQAIQHGSFLPTVYVPGLVESLQGNLLAHIDEAVSDVDSLVLQLQNELAGNHIQTTLQNVDRISGDLTGVSSDLKHLMKNQVPTIVNNADTAVANLNTVVADLKAADLKSTVARVDNAVDGVNSLISDVRSDQGTIGKLIYDKSLYNHIDATVISADSLLTDLKAHPKRYVQISVFGKKEK